MKTIFAPFRFGIGGALAACAMATSLLAANIAAASVPARIRSEVSSSAVSLIKGSQQPLARAEFDAGRMPAGTRLNGITLYFNRSAAQETELNTLLAAQQDPSSPQYHQWLTPDQFAARFGMAQSDIDAVSTWLQQQGFSIDTVSRSRNAIRFSGTVGQVEAAFHTQMHQYTVNGETHFAPSTPLSIPAAFASTVEGIRNLTNFRPRPNHVSARANFTSGQSGNTYFSPGDIATAYDIKPLTSGGNNGAGQTIVIVGQSAVNVADIEAFQSAAGLTKKDPTIVLVPGTGTSQVFGSDQSESDLDLEWSGAIATGANIMFVHTGSNTNYGVFDSIQYAVDELIGNIISVSYSACETQLAASDLTTLEAIFKQAAAQGQTVMAASGDQGSTACAGSTNLTTAQQTAISVNYPASSAYVTGIGGTEMTSADASSSTYWNSTSGTDIVSSLKQYVPEVTWNDDSTAGLSATGGGTSALVARPSWQTGVPGIPSGSMRLVPDVAFYSSPDYVGFLYCTSDTSAWGSSQQASCNSGFRDNATGLLTVAGGTSFATPIFAGMVAILNQKQNYTTGQGLINPTLYQLASNSSTYASAFHDVTVGNNNCTAGSKYCGTTTGGFSAGTGYDEVTGLGSVDLANLATAWPANSGTSATLIGTTTTVTPANTAPAINTNDVFTITVAANSGTAIPSGTVTLQIDGGTTFGGTTLANQTLTNGTLTYTANFTTAGSHQVVAQYSGNSTFAASTGVGSVTIPTSGSGQGTFALAASDVSVARGGTASSTVTVTPSNGYTGTVVLTFSTSNNSALQNLCYSFPTMDSQGNGQVSVTGTSAVTTTLDLDTNASDCVTGAAVKGTGAKALRSFKSMGSSMSADGRIPAKKNNRAPMGVAFAGLLVAGFLARGSRKLRALACIVALAAIGLGLTACGSGNVSVSNPPKGTYTVTVTGTDSATSTITSQTTFNFTIN